MGSQTYRSDDGLYGQSRWVLVLGKKMTVSLLRLKEARGGLWETRDAGLLVTNSY